MSVRVAFVGTGGIGCYAAAHMTKAGTDVVVIDQYPEHVEKMRTQGLQISGLVPRDNFTVRMNALHLSDAQRLAKEAPVDVAFITIKSYDTPWAAALIKPYLAPNGFLVSMQNGLNEEAIAAVVGWGKTMGVVIAGCAAELVGPAHMHRSNVANEGHFTFRVGEVHGRETERVREVVALLEPVDRAKPTTNLWGERWSKLILNTMHNGLASITGIFMPEADRLEAVRSVAIRLGAESVRVGQALGFQLDSTKGIPPEKLARAGEGDKQAYAEVAAAMEESSKRFADDSKPSMAQDVAKGRRTEIDQLNGLVAAKGREIGIPAPANEKVVELVKRVERGELKPSLDNLKGV